MKKDYLFLLRDKFEGGWSSFRPPVMILSKDEDIRRRFYAGIPEDVSDLVRDLEVCDYLSYLDENREKYSVDYLEKEHLKPVANVWFGLGDFLIIDSSYTNKILGIQNARAFELSNQKFSLILFNDQIGKSTYESREIPAHPCGFKENRTLRVFLNLAAKEIFDLSEIQGVESVKAKFWHRS